jgi:hypothetical protein
MSYSKTIIFLNHYNQIFNNLKNQTPLLRVHYTGFPHLGIWTKINAFICIEPWFGYSDSVETGNLMEKEASNRPRTDFFEAKFSIEISNNKKKIMLSINFTLSKSGTERLRRRVDKMMPVPYSITLRRRNDEIHPDHC